MTTDQEFSEPVGSVSSGLVKFVGGASHLTLTSEEGIPELYRARFSGLVPAVDAAGGVVTVRYPSPLERLAARQHSGQVVLNDALPWAVEVAGSVDDLTADLRQIGLRWFGVTQHVSDLSLTLAHPSGVVRIQIGGNAATVNIHRPGGTAVRLQVHGGGRDLQLDGQHLRVVGGGAELSTFEGVAKDRYEIEVVDAASAVTVTSLS